MNALKYFFYNQIWAKEEDVNIIYFTAFDKTFEPGDDGDVGANWGIWGKNESIQY